SEFQPRQRFLKRFARATCLGRIERRTEHPHGATARVVLRSAPGQEMPYLAITAADPELDLSEAPGRGYLFERSADARSVFLEHHLARSEAIRRRSTRSKAEDGA